jgi:hypothetical protein
MWKDSSPIVAQNFSIIVIICALLALTAQWSFAYQFSKNNSCFWSAYLCQNVSLSREFRSSSYSFGGILQDSVMGITLDVADQRARWWPFHGNLVSPRIISQVPAGKIHAILCRWFRFIGSLAANLRYLYRVYAWPTKYGFIGASFSSWILWTPCIADLLYPAVYRMVMKREPMTKVATRGYTVNSSSIM